VEAATKVFFFFERAAAKVVGVKQQISLFGQQLWHVV
jgi:hypothetical protein